MHLKFRNINDAFRNLVYLFSSEGRAFNKESKVVRKESRNGPVLTVEEPIMLSYSQPKERVLFNQSRDANPFFHLYESLWMLAGRNDVEPLAYYASNMRNYSDDRETLNGAYGYRWKHSQVPDHQNWDDGDGVNQLDIIVEHLKADPNSRRAVLQMWNVEDDLLKIGGEKCRECNGTGYWRYKDNEDGTPNYSDSAACGVCKGYPDRVSSKDVCCNLSVMFSIREERNWEGEHHMAMPLPSKRYLDMTVTNRSNDLIWGCLGANYVHFSVLQEYMAARLGVGVGVYNQFSNNLHVYLNDVWQPEAFLGDAPPDFYSGIVGGYPITQRLEEGYDPGYCYCWEKGEYVPLVNNPEVFELELKSVVGNGYGGIRETVGRTNYLEPFFETVAKPMFCAFEAYKVKDWEAAFEWVNKIVASDWKMGAKNWIAKRFKRFKEKGNVPAGTD